jgi:hypothetical protein
VGFHIIKQTSIKDTNSSQTQFYYIITFKLLDSNLEDKKTKLPDKGLNDKRQKDKLKDRDI